MARTAKSAQAETTDVTANDITTVAGFRAEFARQYEILCTARGWCSDGRRYAFARYEGDMGLPPESAHAPSDPQDAAIFGMADEFLNDAGIARKTELHATADATHLDACKRGALQVLKYGIDGGYLTTDADDVLAAVAALGLGVTFSVENYRDISLSGSIYGNAKHAGTDRPSLASRRELSAKMAEHVKTFDLPGFDMGTVDVSVSVDYGSPRTALVIKDADGNTVSTV